MKLAAFLKFAFWSACPRHDQNVGHIVQPYAPPPDGPPEPKIFQLTPAACMRSINEGTYDTGDVRYGPLPAWSGMQAGCWLQGAFPVADHFASRNESQPHPRPVVCDWVVFGMLPWNPSMSRDTMVVWLIHEENQRNSKNRSATPNSLAKVVRFGDWPVEYCW